MSAKTGRKTIATHLYLGAEIVAEMNEESRRLDRELSWLAREAWKRARAEIRAIPAGGLDP